MAKWKCEICGSKFKNFHAQGFDNKIYCPLCFFKKENQELKKQLEEINKMIEKCGFANIEQVMLNYCGLLTQQKKFIKFLEDELLHARYYARDIAHYIEYVLRKYKEITQTKNDKSV